MLHGHDTKLVFKAKSLEKTLHFALDHFESLVFSYKIPNYSLSKESDGV